MNILFRILGAIALAVMASAVWMGCVHIYFKFNPIKVTPATIVLNHEWNVKSVLKVNNRVNKMIYDVWIKFSSKNVDLREKSVELLPAQNEGIVEGKIGNITAGFEIIKIFALDSKGKDCIYLILYGIDPGQTKSYIMNIASGIATSSKEAMKINIRKISHSDTPIQMLSQQGKVAYPFKPPENMQIKSLSLLMKRD